VLVDAELPSEERRRIRRPLGCQKHAQAVPLQPPYRCGGFEPAIATKANAGGLHPIHLDDQRGGVVAAPTGHPRSRTTWLR
jgi:hypothetical protein